MCNLPEFTAVVMVAASALSAQVTQTAGGLRTVI
jgi:hypothetical protein